jgi:hypothetical protein
MKIDKRTIDRETILGFIRLIFFLSMDSYEKDWWYKFQILKPNNNALVPKYYFWLLFKNHKKEI